MYDGEMLVVASRVGAGPSDNGQAVASEFELWPFYDFDVFCFACRGKNLSGRWTCGEQAAGHADDRQFCEQSVHGTNLQLPFLGPHEGRA